MKILFAANTPNSRETGIAKIMNSLADALRAQGDQVDLIFRENIPNLPSQRRLADLLFPMFVVITIRKIWKQRGDHDLIALHSLAASFYIFLRKFFPSMPPCILVSYGADEMRWELELEEEKLGLRKIRFFSKVFYYNVIIRQARYATKHADHVMVAARSEIEYFNRKYKIPLTKITFIPNGVSPENFVRKNQPAAFHKLLFLGGWEWRKGIRYLAEAFTFLAEKYPKITLSLVGIGVSDQTAKESFPLKLHPRIFVESKVSAYETLQRYAENDIFVFPSLFESMSLVVPEAMAAGMPVVTTQACGMQDIIQNERNGLLVAPRDSQMLANQIERLLLNPDLCNQLGRAARITAGELLWDKIGVHVKLMYETVIKEAKITAHK